MKPDPDDTLARMLFTHNPDSQMIVTQVWITPEEAAQVLGSMNTHNRTISMGVVKRMYNDWIAGRFVENGDTICFSKNWVLLDGQHRLRFITLLPEGTRVPCIVVENLDEDVQDTIDTGQVRSVKDMLTIHEIPNSRVIAPITMRILRGFTASSVVIPSKVEQTEFARENAETLVRISIWAQQAVHAIGGRTSQWGAAFWYLFEADPAKCEEFVSLLLDRQSIGPGHPIYQLWFKVDDKQRNRRSAFNGPSAPVNFMAWVFKAWNAWLTGKTIRPQGLGYPVGGESFPRVLQPYPYNEEEEEDDGSGNELQHHRGIVGAHAASRNGSQREGHSVSDDARTG